MRKLNIFIPVVMFCFIGLPVMAGGSGGKTSGKNAVALKAFMEEFGSQIIGMQILKHSKTAEWSDVEKVIGDMEKTVKDLRKADKENHYKSFIDALDNSVADMKAKAALKSKAYLKSFDNLQNTCFRCHITHRPMEEPKTNGFEYSGKNKQD